MNDSYNAYSRLVRIRYLLVISQFILLLFAWIWLSVPETYYLAAIPVLIQLLLNLLQQYRLKSNFIASTLLGDLLLISLFLHVIDGVNNGFVSLLMVPVATAAMLLPAKRTWFLTILACSTYSGLMYFQTAEQSIGHLHQQTNMNQHLIGMWITFVISCLMTSFFIQILRRNIVAQQQRLADLKEQQLRDEQLLMVATNAANAAHELGTPLSTSLMLCEEIVEESQGNTLLSQSALSLKQMLNRCRDIVKEIGQSARSNSSIFGDQQMPLDQQLTKLAQHWLLTRPEIKLSSEISSDLETLFIQLELSVIAAIQNLLDNAADACLDNKSDQVNIAAYKDEGHLHLSISDKGKGINPELIDKLGETLSSSKIDGMGLGYFLANASINRIGGKIWLENAEQGTIAHVLIPEKV